MTGPNRPTGWNKLEELIHKDDFIFDVQSVRSGDDFTRSISYSHIIDKYKIPTKFHNVIKNYIENNVLDMKLVGEYVSVDTTNGVSLKLAFDSNPTSVKKFIDENWIELVEPELRKISPKENRVSASFAPEKQREIYDEYLKVKKEKSSVKEFTDKRNLSSKELDRIKKRFKSNDIK